MERFYRVFFGWYIVGAAWLISFFTGAAILFGFSAMIQPIADDLGWSYTHISLAVSFRGVEMSLISPAMGLLADRWGPRKVVFAGVVLIGMGLIILSRAISLSMFYVAFGILSFGLGFTSSTVIQVSVANSGI